MKRDDSRPELHHPGRTQRKQVTMSGETFAALLEPNLQSVRKLVQTRLRTPDQTDDVVQRTVLRAFTHRDQLRAESKFKSWLWSIAINEVRMFVRGSRHVMSLDDFCSFELRDRAPSPFAICEQRERARILRDAMACLTARDRAAIRLVDLNGLSITEAADRLAVSKAAFKSTHFRARQRLGHALRSKPSDKPANGRQAD